MCDANQVTSCGSPSCQVEQKMSELGLLLEAIFNVKNDKVMTFQNYYQKF